ncbi:MAG: hypothetical protein U1F19_05595 [Lysobacterales bacterium]
MADNQDSAKAELIELHGVRRRYAMDGHAVDALAGIDLRIRAGEFIAITGASGSENRACSTSSVAWIGPPKAAI